MTKVAGTISDIRLNIGKVTVVEDESGKAITLTAGPDVDLKDFSVGDQVIIECDKPSGIIESIAKQKDE